MISEAPPRLLLTSKMGCFATVFKLKVVYYFCNALYLVFLRKLKPLGLLVNRGLLRKAYVLWEEDLLFALILL